MRLGVELSKGYRAGGIVQEGNIQFHKAQFNKAYTEGDKQTKEIGITIPIAIAAIRSLPKPL